jgi:hypothetical protein
VSGPILFEQVVRALPMGSPRDPTGPEPWPDHSLVVVGRTARPGGGAATFGAARLLGGEMDHQWRFYGRQYHASQARRFFGEDCSPPMLGLEEFLEESFWRSCYKLPLRASLVCWSVPAFVSSAAWAVDSRHDYYRFTLFTYIGQDGLRRRDRFRSRVRVRPSSGGRALVHFEDRQKPDPQDFVTRPNGKRGQYRGRFVSLSTLGYDLTGEDQLTRSIALELWGIDQPSVDGPEGLAQELDATCALYEQMLNDLRRFPDAPA